MKARAGLLQYNLYLRDTKTALGSDEELDLLFLTLALLYWFFSYYYSWVVFIFDTLPMFAAVTIYDMSKDFCKILDPCAGYSQTQVLSLALRKYKTLDRI